MTLALGPALVAGCSSGGGAPAPAPPPATTTTTTTASEVTVRGTVAAVSASARVLSLTAPVQGVSNLALTADTAIVRADGSGATLADVRPGATVEATGRPGAPGTVVVRRLVLS